MRLNRMHNIADTVIRSRFRRHHAAAILFTIGCLASAAVQLRAQTEALPTEDQRALDKARTLALTGESSAAIARYRAILSRHPGIPELHMELADLLRSRQQWGEAAAEYRELLSLKPGDRDLLLAYAELLAKDGQYDAAASELSALYDRNPGDRDILDSLVNIHPEGAPREATIRILRELSDRHPADTAVRLQLAKVLSWSKHWDEALAEYSRVLEGDARNFEARSQTAYIHAWTNKWRQAEQELKSLIRERPDEYELQKTLGDIYFYQERYLEADQIYSQVLSYKPDLARQLTGNLGAIQFLTSPQISYNFFYYEEKQHRDEGRSSSNHQQFVECRYPYTGRLTPLIFVGARHDKVVPDNAIFGAGLQQRLLSRLMLEPRFSVEPNRGSNPQFQLRTGATAAINKYCDLSVYDQYGTYWDDNYSNSAGAQPTFFLTKSRTLRLRYGIFYDWIKKPSDYFVRINKDQESRLFLWTNVLSAERDLTLRNGLTITPGYSYSYDSTAVKRNTVFGNASIPFNRFSLNVSGSMGWDTTDYRYLTGGAYLAYRF